MHWNLKDFLFESFLYLYNSIKLGVKKFTRLEGKKIDEK